MTLGIPKSPATCAHEVPEFGCQGCINKDRIAILEKSKKEIPAPPCPECGGPTQFYEAILQSMSIYFVCASGFDSDNGCLICDGEVEVPVL